MGIISWQGQYSGAPSSDLHPLPPTNTGHIHFWWDMGVVAVFSLVIYFWAQYTRLPRDEMEALVARQAEQPAPTEIIPGHWAWDDPGRRIADRDRPGHTPQRGGPTPQPGWGLRLWLPGFHRQGASGDFHPHGLPGSPRMGAFWRIHGPPGRPRR